MRLADRGSPPLLGFPAGRPHLAHTAVRLAVASAHPVLRLAAADPPGAPPAPRSERPALQPVPAGQVVPAAARVALARGAHQAAVAPVRDVPAGAAGARARAHVAPGGAPVGAQGPGEVVREEERRRKQKQLHCDDSRPQGWSCGVIPHTVISNVSLQASEPAEDLRCAGEVTGHMSALQVAPPASHPCLRTLTAR